MIQTLPNQRAPRNYFSKQEDQHLKNLIDQFGENDWDAIATQMPGRTRRQCKERWTHYLSPNVINNPFTKTEDDLLIAKVQTIGHQWKRMESLFPGHKDHCLKNRYKLLMRQTNKNIKHGSDYLSILNDSAVISKPSTISINDSWSSIEDEMDFDTIS
jgi:hypothetical protein